MKRTLFLSLLLSGAAAVFYEASAAESKKAPVEENEEVNLPDKAANSILGMYVGQLGTLKMTLSLDKVVGKSIMGYSVVAGNERAFSGTWLEVEGGLSVLAKEPGDHPEDGVFTLFFDKNAKAKTLTGEWVPYDTKLATAVLDLKAKPFKYNAKLGTYPQSSSRLLKVADVENMHPQELRIMRNEIYARHGYCFRMTDMREHFNNVEWYMPVSVDVATNLTQIEQKNEALIKRYEKYSDKYYDKFGR